MLIGALATDYDGTLASHGVVGPATLDALRRWKASGRALIMVTGRELPDLRRVFPEVGLFDLVVAENGALLHWPSRGETRALAPGPPPALTQALQRLQVRPLAIGEVIVATSSDYAEGVEAAIRDLGLDWRAILNKDSVMCLPAGIDKASGLRAALAELSLPAGEVLGVGDAENDLVFLRMCGVAAAVANALPDVQAAADLVTEGEATEGVAWLLAEALAGRLGTESRGESRDTHAF
ncbi:MAG TPA: HAD family hydrolase [Caulobacteraceae bacterium]